MLRKPTYAGKTTDKDHLDIIYWATQKTPHERLQEAWRLHCINNNIKPADNRLNKNVSKALKRS